MFSRILAYSSRSLLALGLLLPVVLIGIPAVVAYRAEREVKKSFGWVTHTLAVEAAIQKVVNSLVDAETGQRGFLLTRREVYLEPYAAGRARVEDELSTLRQLTRDNASQQQRLDEVQPMIAERLTLLADTIASERSGDHDAALALVNSGRGKFVMDKIRGVLRVMGDEEHRLLWLRQRELSKQAGRSTIVLWSLVAVSAAFAAGLLYLLYRIAWLEPLATVCSQSRTIEHNGEWISFEQYLQRRFGIATTHAISPAEFERLDSGGDRAAVGAA